MFSLDNTGVFVIITYTNFELFRETKLKFGDDNISDILNIKVSIRGTDTSAPNTLFIKLVSTILSNIFEDNLVLFIILLNIKIITTRSNKYNTNFQKIILIDFNH